MTNRQRLRNKARRVTTFLSCFVFPIIAYWIWGQDWDYLDVLIWVFFIAAISSFVLATLTDLWLYLAIPKVCRISGGILDSMRAADVVMLERRWGVIYMVAVTGAGSASAELVWEDGDEDEST